MLEGTMIPKSIHMVGIGGIGMSALAQLFVHEGKRVTGSDREISPTTELLESCGVQVLFGHDTSHLTPGTELLVYSDAIPEDNPERAWARAKHIPEMSYFQALGVVSSARRTIAVTGTHGKTTTSAMIATILRAAKKEPTAIIGSIVRDFPGQKGGSNFLAGNPNLLVVEACEYRNHVLELSPEVLVITNAEWDHTDFFPTVEAVEETFHKAAARVPAGGTVVASTKEGRMQRIVAGSSAHIVNYELESIHKLDLIGDFNEQNARAAKAAVRAMFPDIRDTTMDEALQSFKGSWRRFEYKGKTEKGAIIYDDYAHHPTAVEKTIIAAKEKFPGKRIVVAFHPHLHSRTKSFLHEFARALALADHSIIAPIYRARNESDHGVSNIILADAVQEAGGRSVAIDSFDDIRDALLEEGDDALIITMGAGDIYKVADQLVS